MYTMTKKNRVYLYVFIYLKEITELTSNNNIYMYM